jgi:hypothetical protein
MLPVSLRQQNRMNKLICRQKVNIDRHKIADQLNEKYRAHCSLLRWIQSVNILSLCEVHNDEHPRDGCPQALTEVSERLADFKFNVRIIVSTLLETTMLATATAQPLQI